MKQGQTHLIFSTHKGALVQYKESLRETVDVQVKLFHFSEDEQLDMRKVDEAINENEHAQASVLLLATGSSHLWFDPEHNPRNLELCTTLKNRLDGRINFVVCSTTIWSAASWREHTDAIFGDLLSSSARVDEWNGFDSHRSVNERSVVSLIPDGQHQPTTVHTGWQSCSGDSCLLGGIVKRIFMVLACMLMCYLPIHIDHALAERQRILDRENKAIAFQRKENEDESERLREETDMLSKEKQKLAQENQTLAQMRKSLDRDNKTIAPQQKGSERLRKETDMLSKEKIEKQKLAQENQALAERQRSLDRENTAIAIQRKANEDENEKLRKEKSQLKALRKEKEMQKRSAKQNHTIPPKGAVNESDQALGQDNTLDLETLPENKQMDAYYGL
ncbi:unnamed protein product [Cladocopium goreaui]|uniref:Uncharacterized protein n=1 Tax=Cladocopium goreaui TaxID=2562237 RepID=A0A9P1G980_9DINO|nr:unnamed protein product [Cladocopium goreaui]